MGQKDVSQYFSGEFNIQNFLVFKGVKTTGSGREFVPIAQSKEH